MLLEFVTNNWYLFAGLVVVLALLAADPIRARMSGMKKVSALEMPQVTRDGGIVLDVSEPGEYKKGHIPKSQNIPLKQLQQDLGKLGKQKNKTVVITCRSGNRSVSAARHLAKNGFEDVYVLSGGMMAWEKENLPVDKG